MRWREVTGVICDNNLPFGLKSRIYCTIVRSIILYGTECWVASKNAQHSTHGTEENGNFAAWSCQQPQHCQPPGWRGSNKRGNCDFVGTNSTWHRHKLSLFTTWVLVKSHADGTIQTATDRHCKRQSSEYKTESRGRDTFIERESGLHSTGKTLIRRRHSKKKKKILIWIYN